MKTLRLVVGFACLLTAVLIWWPASDVIELIVRQREVLLGRYSQGHFGALLLLSPLLLMLAVLLLLPMKSRADRVFACIMVPFSTLLSLCLLVLATGWMSKPRYVETVIVEDETAGEVRIQGLVRHREPNQRFVFEQDDKPEQPRSYPNPPAGYGRLPIVLTTDRHGYRNTGELLEHYPIVAVGDSFTAGSHVSDEQVWTVLLSQHLGLPVYNLGVSGSSPRTYLNNYLALGRRFRPETVLFMIYEGNDFRYEPPPPAPVTGDAVASARRPLGERLKSWAKASPVTLGLRRLSAEVLQPWGADAPVPGYDAHMGWMPLRIDTPAGPQHYAFSPKRLRYLNVEADDFAASRDWLSVRDILLQMQTLAQQDGFRLIVLYAPSTPHVVLPLAGEQAVPAEQLRRFLAYESKRLPEDAQQLKQDVMARLDNQESVLMGFCADSGIECLSLTQPMQQAIREGRQTYFSYDQHWAPPGNAVVAEVLTDYLRSASPSATAE